MKSKNAIFLLACLCAVANSNGQGTLQITFDGPPPQPPGTAALIQEYTESGMLFTPLPGSVGFVRSGGGRDIFAENGTTYLQGALGVSLMFSFSDLTPFDLLSVELAEFSVSFTNDPVTFVGHRQDGSTVTTTFIPDGIIDGTGPLADFETFEFDSDWSGLTRVEVPTFLSAMDNLVVIPEPATSALLLVGGGIFIWLRGLRGRRGKSNNSNP